MMVTDNFQCEMRILSQLSSPLVFMVEVHAVRLSETVHEFIGIGGLHQLVGVG